LTIHHDSLPLHRLTLTHFRNYRTAGLETRGDMSRCRPERRRQDQLPGSHLVSLPRRGLRRATLEDVADNQGDGSWAVSAEVEGALGLATLGTGIEAPRADAAAGRRCRIDARAWVRRPPSAIIAHGLADTRDGRLFMGAASERRRFFDRLVLAIDSEHSRPGLGAGPFLALAQPPSWRCAISTTIGATRSARDRRACVAVAATRGQTALKLAAMLRARGQASAVSLRGDRARRWMENALLSEPATAVEDRYRKILREARVRDAAAGAPSMARISPICR